MVLLSVWIYDTPKGGTHIMSNIYTNDELAKASSIAQFRLSLIAPVVQGLLTDFSATAYYQRITKEPLTLPDGSGKIPPAPGRRRAVLQ